MSKRPSLLVDIGATDEAPVVTTPAPIKRRVRTAPEDITDPDDIVRTSIYITRNSHERFREIAYTERRTVLSLFVEAFDDFLQKRGWDGTARVKLGPGNWKKHKQKRAT